MLKAEEMRALLAEKYGIRSDSELMRAISRMEKLDITPFVATALRQSDTAMSQSKEREAV